MTAPTVVVNTANDERIGQGLGSTRWKGCFCKVAIKKLSYEQGGTFENFLLIGRSSLYMKLTSRRGSFFHTKKNLL
jgi:hypothetical protein